MTRSRRILVIVIAVLVVVAVAGSVVIGALGTSSAPDPDASPSDPSSPPASASPDSSVTPSPGPSETAAASALLPVYAEPFTADAAGAESNRVADLMVAFVGATETGGSAVINDDPISQVIPGDESAASQFGVLHTLTLDPSVGATTQVEALRTALVAGGWTEQEVSDAPEQFLVALTSGTDTARSWFLVVAADRSVPGESVVSIQLLSPDLP